MCGELFAMEGICYKNVNLNPHRYYFLYIGELKAVGLNDFVRQALLPTHGPDVGCISIVSDVVEHYPLTNVIAINPEALALSRQLGRRVAQRIPAARLARLASESGYIRELVRWLLSNQGEVYVWMFESKPELTLTDIPGVKLLGPDARLAYQFNNKLWQYETFGPVVPMADYRICGCLRELRRVTDSLRAIWRDGIFVSTEYSAAGAGSMVTRDCQEMIARFTDPSARYLASRYLPHEYDPTVLAVVANEEEVYVAGVADMRIEGGNRFRGSSYPSVLPLNAQEECREHTRAVGRVLGRLGYRGVYGCDFIIDPQGGARFIEVNTRKQGTTMEFCCTQEQALAKGQANLLELEYLAVLHNSFLDRAPAEPRPGEAPLHWGTYNHKVDLELVTGRSLVQEHSERNLFRRVARGGPGGHVVLEHVGANTLTMPGTFLGRVASVGRTREAMRQGLSQGMERVQASIAAYASSCAM